MIQRYDGQQARRMRMALVADNVYCIVSDALKKLYPEKTPLNSVEIWMAAQGLTNDLIQSPAPEEIFEDLLEELREEGGELREPENSVFLILMVSMCQISALRKQIENADVLLKREMDVCRKHEMYYKVLEQFDGKEIQMRMIGRKVDLLNYEMMEAGNNKEERRKLLDDFVEAMLKLGPQNMASNLLALNYLNLKNGHIYDDRIMGLYEQLEKKFVPKPGIEVTMGNKNVAEAGGMQMNGEMPQDMAGALALFNQLKQLGDGK